MVTSSKYVGIEELREKRDEIKKILQVEEEEKANIQKDLVVLTKRLAEIDDSLSRKYAYTNEYDKTIHEVEAAYSKVCASVLSNLYVPNNASRSSFICLGAYQLWAIKS